MSYSARRPEHRSTRCFANRNYARTTPPPPAPAAPTAARSPVAGGVRPGQPPAAPPPAVPSRPSPAQPSRRAHPRAQPSRRCHRPAAPSRPHPQPDQPPVAPRPTAGPGADHRQNSHLSREMCGYSPYLSRFGRTNRVRSRRPTTILRTALLPAEGRLEFTWKAAARRLGTAAAPLFTRDARSADSSPQTHGLAGSVRFGMNWPRWMGGDKSPRA